jgi:hypothetical protein
MTDTPEDVVTENKFPITSIEKTEPPAGATEGQWYEYIIGQGSSSIKGKRAGSLRGVTEYVEEYADNLNRRAALGYSAYAARKPTNKPTK